MMDILEENDRAIICMIGRMLDAVSTTSISVFTATKTFREIDVICIGWEI